MNPYDDRKSFQDAQAATFVEDEASLAGRTIELVSSIESLCEAIADRAAANQLNKYGPDVGTSSHLVNIARDKLTQTILDILRPKT